MKMLSGARRGKIPTSKSLENAALFYLGRYAASAASLQRVLENKIRRAARYNSAFAKDDAAQKELRAAIEAIVAKHIKTGVLNDAAYAELKTAAFRRAGRSARAIHQRLKKSGVASATIHRALAGGAEDADAADAELAAALALARRRKLGPFRKAAAAPDQKRKDLATLARAGFSFDIARQVLGKGAEDMADDI